MKKLWKVLASFSAIALISAVMAACGGNSVVGKWVPQKMDVDMAGVKVSLNFSSLLEQERVVYGELIGMFEGMELEFFSDGTCTFMGEEGEYKLKGSKLVFYDEDGEEEDMEEFGSFELQGNKLVLRLEFTEGGITTKINMVFKKVVEEDDE
ncbi:MAG: hypothetical protein FWD58_02965 [Firmicutes bacterium]|nr:hypothetical protein [Bacillota bacterium]